LKPRTILILAAAATLGGGMAGCSNGSSDDGNDRLTVVASFYPLEEVARAVGGRGVEVENLTPPGVEPHDLELSSDQLDSILDADVVLYLGGGFQPAVEDAVRQRDQDQVTVDVLARLGSEVQAPAGEGEGGATADPHVWLDPVLMTRITGIVMDALNEADLRAGRPPPSVGRAESALGYTESLGRLDDTYASRLADCSSNLIVTTHAAFGYLADRYGLRQQPITGLSPEGEPDPARLAEIEDLVRDEHVTTVFTEPLVPSDVADTIARETGAKVDVLNPIEGLTPEQREGGEDYFSIMRQNLDALVAALGCSRMAA